MTDDHFAHLQDPGVLAAQAALDRHLVDHKDCGDAPYHRYLCPDGERLHDAVVTAAQDAYRAAHPEAFDPEPHDAATGGFVKPGAYLVGETGPERLEPHHD